MDISTIMTQVSIWAIPVLMAITLHEAAHGYAARLCGDMTATMMGRVTLNPLKHIDPVGTVILPLLMMVTTGFIIGWAKPVPVNFFNLKNGRQGQVFVALAGPGANLVLIIFSILLMHILPFLPATIQAWLAAVTMASVQINLILMVFNLMPILPLDGGRVMQALLPKNLAYRFGRLEPYGMWIVILLAVTGILFSIIRPIMMAVLVLLSPLFPSFM